MKIRSSKTTQVTKPNRNKKTYAPQTPDVNKPDLGRPTQKITKSLKKGKPTKN